MLPRRLPAGPAPLRPPGSPGAPGESAGADGGAAPPGRYRRPLAVTGAIAAFAVAGTGVALLTTLTAIGWITAPHAGLGNGLPGVLRTAITLWLAAHHVAFSLHGAGQIGMLPLGPAADPRRAAVAGGPLGGADR